MNTCISISSSSPRKGFDELLENLHHLQALQVQNYIFSIIWKWKPDSKNISSNSGAATGKGGGQGCHGRRAESNCECPPPPQGRQSHKKYIFNVRLVVGERGVPKSALFTTFLRRSYNCPRISIWQTQYGENCFM